MNKIKYQSLHSQKMATIFKATLAAAVIAVGLVAGSPAEGQPPDNGTEGAHFLSAESSVNGEGALVVNWSEAGLGNGNADGNVTYTMTADATAEYACFNKSGKNPKAANKADIAREVQSGGTFDPKNGRVNGELEAGPLAPSDDLKCGEGQEERLLAVSYTNIELTDTTNGVSTDVPDPN